MAVGRADDGHRSVMQQTWLRVEDQRSKGPRGTECERGRRTIYGTIQGALRARGPQA